MRIAQVAPLFESVPPKLYGGTERVVSYLTEELVVQGHDVTLFASGDSLTNAKLESVINKALRLNINHPDPMAYHIIMLERLSKMIHLFDVIHFHFDALSLPLSRYLSIPSVTTMHGRLDLPDLQPLYREFTHVPLVSISDNQRNPLSFANWVSTVYNGVPQENYHFNPHPGDYLAFLGRISPEKGIERAIEIATRVGMKLCIAAKVDKVDEDYFQTQIKPLLAHPLIEYVGEIDEFEKDAFLGNAYAVLFPIDWPEPFGLVMIEAFATGTPVVAFNRGSVPEVMLNGETGFIVNTIDEAIEAVENIETISRHCCRHIFEKRFTASHMTANYLKTYQMLIHKNTIREAIAS